MFKLLTVKSTPRLCSQRACAKTWTMDDGQFLFTVKTLKPAHLRSCTLLSFIVYFIVYYCDNNTNIAKLITKNGFSVRFTA